MERSEAHFLDFFERIGLVVLLIDPASGAIVDANPAASGYYGYARTDFIGMPMSRINTVPTTDLAPVMRQALNNECNYFDFSHRLASGEIRDVEVYLHPLTIKGKAQLFTIVRDITERKQADIRIKEQAALLELAHDSIVVRDMDARITFWNQGAAEHYGWTREQAIGRISHELLKTRFPVPVEEIDAELARSGRWDGELVHVRKDGGEITVSSRCQVQMRDGVPFSVFEISHDITDRKQLERELEQQAHTDYLTGINNRRRFMQLAELELARVRRYGNTLSFLILDIDFFKRINDTHGHNVGDTVLVKLASLCKQVLREIDVMGRFGGEEFVIMLPQTGMDAAVAGAERLREVIEKARIPMEKGLPIQFTVSIGVSSLGSRDEPLDWLLDRADRAMYAAKNAGRNRVMAATNGD